MRDEPVKFVMLILVGVISTFGTTRAQTILESEVVVSKGNDTATHNIFELTVEDPVFKKGGLTGLIKYLARNINIPSTLTESGKIIIELTIDTLGKVREMRIIKGLHPLIDQEVLRVCSKLEFVRYHNPAPVETKFILPIYFEIPGKE